MSFLKKLFWATQVLYIGWCVYNYEAVIRAYHCLTVDASIL